MEGQAECWGVWTEELGKCWEEGGHGGPARGMLEGGRLREGGAVARGNVEAALFIRKKHMHSRGRKEGAGAEGD
jgi:hypothetical protein